MSADVELWLVRHGETEWSLSGAHTSRTDIPLTDHGRQRAEELRDYLKGTTFDAVLTSPMQRARETCAIAGLGGRAVVEEGLREWDYGMYEGKTTKEIRETEPGWSVWSNDIKNGETVEQVGERADGVIERALAASAAAGGKGGGAGGAICARAHSADPGGTVDEAAGGGWPAVRARDWKRKPAGMGARDAGDGELESWV